MTGFFICHDFALPLHLFEVQGKKDEKSGSSFLVMIVIAVVAAGIGYWKLTGEESDTLRKIVLEECLPNQQQNQNPSPCAEVKPNAGYVVLKDLNGPLQYLLMPTYRINGTESPLLTDPSTPNFFWLAWQARDFMSKNTASRFPIARFLWRSTPAPGVRKTIFIFISLVFVLMCANNWIKSGEHQQPLVATARWFARA